MPRLPLLLCLLALPPGCGRSTEPTPNATSTAATTPAPAAAPALASEREAGDVVLVADDDPAMAAAIAQARDSLDEFLALVDQPPEGAEGFKLKVALSDGKATEHFWVSPFRQVEDGFEGILANEPQLVAGYTAGQEITFKRAQVSDWGYTRAGKQVGSFTVCALFKQMPAAEVEFYRREHGFDCHE